jgi:hypothetical protein
MLKEQLDQRERRIDKLLEENAQLKTRLQEKMAALRRSRGLPVSITSILPPSVLSCHTCEVGVYSGENCKQTSLVWDGKRTAKNGYCEFG